MLNTHKETLPFLSVDHLSVEFETRQGTVNAVKDVSFEIHKGSMIAVVGESGSGKSVTAYSVLGLLGDNGRIAGGKIVFDGLTLHPPAQTSPAELRGREISMIFQNPMSTLNPIRKVGKQIKDMLLQHLRASPQTAEQKVEKLLEQVQIKDIQRVKNAYPFELSGGMCQRVMIAIALACEPRLLIADEPTTGLDVTTQKSIMDLIHHLAKEKGLAVLLITHDLGVAQQYCDQVVVMEKGLVVERSNSKKIFSEPEHPYSQKLLAATPRRGISIAQLTLVPPPLLAEPKIAEQGSPPLLQIKQLVKCYDTPAKWPWQKNANAFYAVNEVSFELHAGECLGLVGESGCGKSTLSKMITGLEMASAGEIVFAGKSLTDLTQKQRQRSDVRRDIQMVFQDPTGSLNPRHTVFQLISEPLYRLEKGLSKSELTERVQQLAERVGLPAEFLPRLAHQLSGGQKARVGIARAIALKPKLLILDEPTSALDVSIQAIVLQLLEQLRRELGMSYLFISHDLNVVKMLSQRVLVMKEGKIVEAGRTEQVLNEPQHPFTQRLIASLPNLEQAS